jgi:acetate---CoA ligase (ADP-forming)
MSGVAPSPATSGVAPSPELVRLRDGSQVTLRRARDSDEPALRALLAGLSPEARRLRFFSGAVDVAGAAHLTGATGSGRYGLVAHDEGGVLIAHAFVVALDEHRAEVAVEVAERLHGRGLGTILIERLAAEAERHGITRLVADVLPENHAMLNVFRDGFDAHVAFADGSDKVELPTSAWRTASERFPESQR